MCEFHHLSHQYMYNTHLLTNNTALGMIQQDTKCRTPDSTRDVLTMCCQGDATCLRGSQRHSYTKPCCTHL